MVLSVYMYLLQHLCLKENYFNNGKWTNNKGNRNKLTTNYNHKASVIAGINSNVTSN